MANVAGNIFGYKVGGGLHGLGWTFLDSLIFNDVRRFNNLETTLNHVAKRKGDAQLQFITCFMYKKCNWSSIV